MRTTTALSTLTLNVGGHTLPFEGINYGQRPYGNYCWFIAGPAEDFGFETGSTLPASIVTSAPQPTAEIVSRPRDGTAYRNGEVIRVVLWFEEDVRVSGSPQLELDIGGQTRLADYVPARRGRTAAFEYTVTEDDADADGVSIRANTDESSPSLLLNGGEFLWVSFLRGEVVDLGFGAVPAGAGHAVNGADADTTAPVLSAATIRYGLLELTYSKPLRSDPQMMSGVATSAWSVTVNGAPAALAAAYIIDTVRLVLQSPVDHDDVVTVSSSVLMQDRAEPPNTEAALLDGRSVTNETPAAKPVVEIAADADAWFESEDDPADGHPDRRNRRAAQGRRQLQQPRPARPGAPARVPGSGGELGATDGADETQAAGGGPPSGHLAGAGGCLRHRRGGQRERHGQGCGRPGRGIDRGKPEYRQ